MAAIKKAVEPVVYRIGTPGVPWGDAERAAWLAQCTYKRSYNDEVVAKINALRDDFEVKQYGALSIDQARFPLFALLSKTWDPKKPCVLVTGGVHGYETSGVQGALRFATVKAKDYFGAFNLCICPCVSP